MAKQVAPGGRGAGVDAPHTRQVAQYPHRRTMASGALVIPGGNLLETDERWGEVPVAHVGLHPDKYASEQEIIDHVRARLARFKAPKRVIFGPLPRTSTGKVQKFALRNRENLDEDTQRPTI